MSWPLRVQNTHFLLKLYGNYPSLDRIEVTELSLDRDGPAMTVNFITNQLPNRETPKEWGEFNAIFISIMYLDICDVLISDFKSNGFSRITIEENLDRFSVTMEGAVCCKFKSRFLIVQKIGSILQEG